MFSSIQFHSVPVPVPVLHNECFQELVLIVILSVPVQRSVIRQVQSEARDTISTAERNP